MHIKQCRYDRYRVEVMLSSRIAYYPAFLIYIRTFSTKRTVSQVIQAYQSNELEGEKSNAISVLYIHPPYQVNFTSALTPLPRLKGKKKNREAVSTQLHFPTLTHA